MFLLKRAIMIHYLNLLKASSTITILVNQNYNIFLLIDNSALEQCIKNKGCGSDTLVIDEDQYCHHINNPYWKYIIVGDNVCNAVPTLNVDSFYNVQSIQIGRNSFNSVQSFSITNNAELTAFVVGDGSFNSAKSLKISRNSKLQQVIMGSNSFQEVVNILVKGISI